MSKVFKLLLAIVIIAGVTWKVNDVTSKRPDTPDPMLVAKDGVCLGLNYHRVKKPHAWNKIVETLTGSDDLKRYNVYADEFQDQIRWMKQAGVHFATLGEIEGYVRGEAIPEKCVWLSFDDVDHTVYENAFPVLREEGVPFTLFVITGHVGETFQNLNLAPWHELEAMKDSGLADFGSHTNDMHYIEDGMAVFLDPANHDAFKRDLEASRAALNEQLGIDATAIAYPFGETDDAVTAIAESAGFTDAFILSPNPITNDNAPYFIDRYLLDKHVFDEFVKPYLSR